MQIISVTNVLVPLGTLKKVATNFCFSYPNFFGAPEGVPNYVLSRPSARFFPLSSLAEAALQLRLPRVAQKVRAALQVHGAHEEVGRGEGARHLLRLLHAGLEVRDERRAGEAEERDVEGPQQARDGLPRRHRTELPPGRLQGGADDADDVEA